MEDLTLHTVSSLKHAFQDAGLEKGMTILMHSSMKSIGGWVCGGAEAVVYALMETLTPTGTLMMPTHTSNNTDPQYWRHPPVPAEWWQRIRDETPPFNPATTITRMMGTIAENFRRFPDVKRSLHPIGSFAAWGQHADYLTQRQPLEAMFGEDSPLARLYEVGGSIFMLGVSHSNNTALHLAEHRAPFKKILIGESSSMWVDGKRERVQFTMLDYDDDDFPRIGADYEAHHHPHIIGKVGKATTRLMPMRSLVDYGVWWMEQYRP